MTSSTVVIYGSSLFLAGIEASLKRCAGLTVRSLDGRQPVQALLPLEPDVIIVDSTHLTCSLAELESLFGASRTSLIIALDQDSDQARVHQSWQQPVRRADELLALIQNARARVLGPGEILCSNKQV